MADPSWHTPEGWQISPSAQVNVSLPHYIGGWVGIAKAEFTLIPPQLNQSRSDLFCGCHLGRSPYPPGNSGYAVDCVSRGVLLMHFLEIFNEI